MIGTIRKHSKVLWGLTIPAIIISLFWFFLPNRMGGGGGRNADFGTIYGKKITSSDYIEAKREFYLYYFFNNGEWPDKNTRLSAADLDREIYVRMMLFQKSGDLGIYVG